MASSQSQSLSALQRDSNIQKMQDQEFDLVIIGGGINGAGVARDAASRGMKVALVEERDFAWGTSSRSSKLVHGGIRYLEQYEFGLVFEALSERQRLFELAPHLVHPLKFVIPLYRSGRVKPGLLKLGMMAYDFLSLYDAPELHASFTKKELLQDYPLLQDQELLGGFTYYDAYMDDDRLVHETMRSAARFGAVIANFVRAQRPVEEDDRVVGIHCVDTQTQKDFQIRARHVMSCVGPWTDKVGSDLLKDWKPIMRPSKGVHLTFDRERLNLKDAVVMAAEKRIVFAIPRHEMTIIGTTDTDFKADPSQVVTTKEDVDYLLKVAQKYFPGANLQKSDIVASYAGVRPLVFDGAETESGTSREHVIIHNHRGVSFMAGGKYTTYRHMAEEAMSGILSQWDFDDQMKFREANTLEPLHPKCSVELYQRAQREAGRWTRQGFDVLNGVQLARLADRHGMEFVDLIEQAKPFLGADSEENFWKIELIQAINETMCRRLEDFYFRRVPLFLARKDHGLPFLESLSQTMAQVLGWSDSERREQVNALQKQIQHERSWRD